MFYYVNTILSHFGGLTKAALYDNIALIKQYLTIKHYGIVG